MRTMRGISLVGVEKAARPGRRRKAMPMDTPRAAHGNDCVCAINAPPTGRGLARSHLDPDELHLRTLDRVVDHVLPHLVLLALPGPCHPVFCLNGAAALRTTADDPRGEAGSRRTADVGAGGNPHFCAGEDANFRKGTCVTRLLWSRE